MAWLIENIMLALIFFKSRIRPGATYELISMVLFRM